MIHALANNSTSGQIKVLLEAIALDWDSLQRFKKSLFKKSL
jgi:hypothetical protein